MVAPRWLDEGYLDRWLKRSLHERYSAVLREPVPDELIRLLSKEQ